MKQLTPTFAAALLIVVGVALLASGQAVAADGPRDVTDLIVQAFEPAQPPSACPGGVCPVPTPSARLDSAAPGEPRRGFFRSRSHTRQRMFFRRAAGRRGGSCS